MVTAAKKIVKRKTPAEPKRASADSGNRTNRSGELERVPFETSRAMELLTRSELQKQSGAYPEQWAGLLFKELTDNGIDAADYAGRAPVIKATVSAEALSVHDNGDGFAEGTIDGIVKFESRTSTNSKVASLTRGSQGLGAKIAAAIPFVVCQTEPREGQVTISTRGIGKKLVIRANEVAGIPEAAIQDAPPNVKFGSSVTVHWPQEPCILLADGSVQILRLADCFAFANPHLSLEIRCPDGEKRKYAATDPEWIDRRWSARKASPGAWYDRDGFRALLGATVHRLEQRGETMTVREWVSENFAGLKATAKKSAVVEQAGLSKKEPLSALVTNDGSQFDERRVDLLYQAVRETSRTISHPRTLGVIGEDHLRRRCEEFGGRSVKMQPGSFRYKVAYGFTEDERPFVVECAFMAAESGPSDGTRVVLAGVNGSPSIDMYPFKYLDEYGVESFEGLLDDQECGRNDDVLIFAHLTIPRPEWDGLGKTRMRITDVVGEKLQQALKSVTKDWAAQRRREKRNADAELRRQEELERAESRSEKQVCLDAAIYLEMQNAVQEASGGGRFEFPGRNLFYSIRDLIQQHTEKALTQSYFDQVLKRWQKERGLIDNLYRDPRGHLVEPHTGEVIPLGTREVLQYHIPEWLYSSLLYIEKKGFLPMLKEYGVPELYDMGIVAAEGYATDAAKMLMAMAAESDQEMRLLCLHDADPYGKNIHRKLCEATLRSPKIHVIDIGLTVEDALELGLEPENFIRKKALPKGLQLTPQEREWWEGEFHGHYTNKSGKRRKKYLCKRVELNALAKNPDAFMSFLKRKLEEVGCDRKLVPPAMVIADLARQKRLEFARDMARQEVERLLDIDAIVDEVADKVARTVSVKTVPEHVRQWGSQLSRQQWRSVVAQTVRESVDAKSERLMQLVAARVRDIDI